MSDVGTVTYSDLPIWLLTLQAFWARALDNHIICSAHKNFPPDCFILHHPGREDQIAP